MDDKSKRRIRGIAKRLHWLLQVIFGILVIFYLTIPFVADKVAGIMSDATSDLSLLGPESVLSDMLLYQTLQSSEAIATFPPPVNVSEIPVWGSEVAAQLDQPCAVYYYDGLSKVYWPVLPEDYESFALKLEPQLLAQETCNLDSPRTQTMGTIFMQRGALKADSILPGDSTEVEKSFVAFGLSGSRERWGAIFDFREGDRAFLRKLQTLRENKVVDDLNLKVLDNLYHLRRDPAAQGMKEIETIKYGLRIFDTETDSLLFQTADLDTTNRMYEAKFSFPVWYQVFESDHERNYRDIFNEAVSDVPSEHWLVLLLYLATMFVLALFYRWILKLTTLEPKLSPSGD